jgi:hypothetical protein
MQMLCGKVQADSLVKRNVRTATGFDYKLTSRGINIDNRRAAQSFNQNDPAIQKSVRTRFWRNRSV